MIPRPEDNLLGKLAVAFGFVTPGQLEECVRAQSEIEAPPLLGTLLLERGYIERDELRDLIEFQKEKLSSADTRRVQRENDRMFGYLAIQLGLVTATEIRAAVEEQVFLGKRGLRFRLGEILVKRGALKAEKVDEILRRQQRYLVICPSCDRRHVAFDREPGETFACACGRALQAPE
mgnify:CR=1 FL=1